MLPAEGSHRLSSNSSGLHVLVTGGAGYVGSVCAEMLVSHGLRVTVLDDFREGHRAAVPRECGVCECDLLDVTGVEDIFKTRRFDAVMHFAAEALVEKSMREPSVFYRTNVAGGVILLDAMVRHGISKIVFSSTAAVYGEPQTVPIPEDHPKNPINPYGQSKWRFETILSEYARFAGIKYVALRYFNAAGASRERGEAHRKETHLIPKILEAAAGEMPEFQIRGTDYPTPDGTCVRDYIHVIDIAHAHALALKEIDRVSGEAFNVGTSHGYSIREVVDTARRVTGRAIPAVECSRRPGDPAVLVASSTKLQKTLGWKAAYSSLEQIIESAWLWKHTHPHGYEGSLMNAR
ncbi:MAG TPA: UDP-glucose 4-epimerase GalE [Candidatus Acidoferrales bacterium]|nr:UDP-glucose 4-epimerase GalE [Candidatus Acidoferrales bacterium]